MSDVPILDMELSDWFLSSCEEWTNKSVQDIDVFNAAAVSDFQVEKADELFFELNQKFKNIKSKRFKESHDSTKVVEVFFNKTINAQQ